MWPGRTSSIDEGLEPGGVDVLVVEELDHHVLLLLVVTKPFVSHVRRTNPQTIHAERIVRISRDINSVI